MHLKCDISLQFLQNIENSHYIPPGQPRPGLSLCLEDSQTSLISSQDIRKPSACQGLELDRYIVRHKYHQNILCLA